MANECFIKLTKKTTPQKLISLVVNCLQDKFKISSTGTFDKKNKFIEIKFKELIIGFWIEGDTLVFYDTSDSALWNFHPEDSVYTNRPIMDGTGGFFGLLLGYSYLHHYVINFMAQEFKTVVGSGGAGDCEPFAGNHPRYESYENWFDFMSQGLHSRNAILSKILLTNKKVAALKEAELAYFPELK